MMSKSKWIEAMKPIVVSSSWHGDAQHLMFLMHPFGLAGHAEVIVWAHHALEADSINVLVAAVTDHTRMSWASLVWVICFTSCLIKSINDNGDMLLKCHVFIMLLFILKEEMEIE